MSHRTPRSRKRRRSQAVAEPAEEAAAELEKQVEDEIDAADGEASAPRAEPEAENNAEPTKEQVIWEAFREEHYELLEQLPLSLHRSFTLMRELDQQVIDYRTQLLPTLKDYIVLRQKIHSEKMQERAALEESNGKVEETQTEDAMMIDSIKQSDEAAAVDALQELANGRAYRPARPDGSQTPTILTPPMPNGAAESGQSSRGMLTRVAQLAEEVLRASNEKVNVARFAYDLVDRYIRDLDRAIKEQESSLTLGVRPGTHLANIMLLEPTLPRSTRGSGASQSPVDMGVDVARAPELGIQQEQDINIGVVSVEPASEGATTRRKKGRSGRKSTPKDAEAAKSVQAVQEARKSLKLTVPPLASIALYSNEMPIDPNEPRYCYCNQVSFGEMIACDNPECPREWFHLGCVGLKQAPKGKWFCRDCAEALAQAQTSRRKAR
ncbi:hypothetical protein OBBRIDRAFT_822978 [Obba rivulosa]|uniref:Chromatin modification-related protein n=1 Tax=Obba rivulosa TaxID=1052685 RepID=A0A8E2J5T8_9APHY|nr:hypothetical protein OBBRIDRAFT_822978 [Obba rivulosa]